MGTYVVARRAIGDSVAHLGAVFQKRRADDGYRQRGLLRSESALQHRRQQAVVADPGAGVLSRHVPRKDVRGISPTKTIEVTRVRATAWFSLA